MGVESAAVYYGEERYGFSLTQVRTVDTIVGLSTLVGYGLLFVFILLFQGGSRGGKIKQNFYDKTRAVLLD